MNNTLKSMTDFATSTGRLAFETWGDSTVERSGGGHSVGFAKGLFGLVLCAGQLVPINTTAAFNDTMGLNECRRRNNASTKVGVVNDIGVDANGYPVTFKQYGCQIPVPAAGGYIGPQAAYLAGSDLTVEILIGDVMAGAGVITVTSTANHLSSGRVKIDSEIFQYTGKTATTFTGVTRANLGTVAAGHSVGAIAGQCDNGAAASTMLSASKHPIGSGASFIQSLFYLSAIDANAAPSATAWPSFDTTATPVNTDTTYTNKAAGAAQALGSAGYAIGSLHRIDLAYTGADLTNTAQVTLNFGTSPTNGRGPAGPAALLYQGLFEANRPYGGIQSEGISRGGKTLNALLKALRVYDATNTVCEFDAGLLTRLKVMGGDTTNGVAATALGGNQVAGFCQVTCTGHNESTAASTAETALVDPTEAWTIARQTTINGGTAVSDSSTTAITVVSTSGSPAAGCIRIGDEFITYTAITATTYQGTITRGMYGSVPAAHADDSVVYQGNLVLSPLGLATDLLFDYNLKKAKWVAAGGSASRFWYVWVRPIPISATKTAIADNTAISGGTQAEQYAQKEYRFDRYAQTIGAYLGTRDGFIVADMSTVYAGGDALAYDLGVLPGAAGDQVHNSNATYEQAWHRYFSAERVALASIKPPRGRN